MSLVIRRILGITCFYSDAGTTWVQAFFKKFHNFELKLKVLWAILLHSHAIITILDRMPEHNPIGIGLKNVNYRFAYMQIWSTSIYRIYPQTTISHHVRSAPSWIVLSFNNLWSTSLPLNHYLADVCKCFDTSLPLQSYCANGKIVPLLSTVDGREQMSVSSTRSSRPPTLNMANHSCNRSSAFGSLAGPTLKFM